MLPVKGGDQIFNRFRIENISDDFLILKDNSTGKESRIPVQK